MSAKDGFSYSLRFSSLNNCVDVSGNYPGLSALADPEAFLNSSLLINPPIPLVALVNPHYAIKGYVFFDFVVDWCIKFIVLIVVKKGVTK